MLQYVRTNKDLPPPPLPYQDCIVVVAHMERPVLVDVAIEGGATRTAIQPQNNRV